jgi:3'-phosphoadenosine 5'-phosphosulfate sulfotransferase (PAPS reductase)/FAD synthetase
MQQRQALTLDQKIVHTNAKIREWYEAHDGNVSVSFSGGKDSTVLLDLCRKLYPDMEAVFIDTGIEYKEVRNFVRTVDNVTFVKPRMSFKKVIEEYGYPVASKTVSGLVKNIRSLKRRKIPEDDRRYTYCWKRLPIKWRKLIDAPFKISDICCTMLKKHPFHKYCKESGNVTYSGEMASDSKRREKVYLEYGRINYSKTNPRSKPMSIWKEQDVLKYIVDNDLEYAPIYGDIVSDDNGALHCTGHKRTGCAFCPFGAHLEKPANRYQMMYYEHPRLWDYCINRLGYKEILDYSGVKYLPEGVEYEKPRHFKHPKQWNPAEIPRGQKV